MNATDQPDASSALSRFDPNASKRLGKHYTNKVDMKPYKHRLNHRRFRTDEVTHGTREYKTSTISISIEMTHCRTL